MLTGLRRSLSSDEMELRRRTGPDAGRRTKRSHDSPPSRMVRGPIWKLCLVGGAAFFNAMIPTNVNLPLTTVPPDRFDLELARDLAGASADAYDRSVFGDHLIESGKTDAAARITVRGDSIVLAFRGTRNLKDWAADCRFFKKPIARGIKVHEGFLADADSILPRIVDCLLPPACAGATTSKDLVTPLLITGHSLGGALASLAAYFLHREGFRVRGVYTFASPRVGNAGWRNAYRDSGLWPRTFRIARAGDAVPHVPGLFQPLLDGYRHVGNEILLVPCDCGQCGAMNLAVNPSRVFSFAVDEISVARAVRRGEWDFFFDLHEISGYEAALAAVSK
jgi:Lipase (class 3)